MDGKHVAINPPPNSGSYYWNYKGFNSIVLLALANANYEFLMCDVGTNGRVSDGGVLNNTKFGQALVDEELKIPNPSIPAHSTTCLPYVFIGDEAFALRKDFLKPFTQKDLTQERRVFNYRLSRARRVIENVFGIMCARFGVFSRPINLKVENIEKIVLSCCVLHNFLRNKCSSTYSSELNEDLTDIGSVELNMVQLQRTFTRNPGQEAKEVRNKFMTYFNTAGALSWLNDKV